MFRSQARPSAALQTPVRRLQPTQAMRGHFSLARLSSLAAPDRFARKGSGATLRTIAHASRRILPATRWLEALAARLRRFVLSTTQSARQSYATRHCSRSTSAYYNSSNCKSVARHARSKTIIKEWI